MTDIDDSILSYEYFQDKNVCRLCWRKEGDQDLFSISQNEGNPTENTLVSKIKECLNLEYEENSFPSKACSRCSTKVEEFYEFKHSCQNTEKRLQDILRNYQENAKQSEIDVKIKSEPNVIISSEKYDSLSLPVEFIGTNYSSDLQYDETSINNETDVDTNESKYILGDDLVNAYTCTENDICSSEHEEHSNSKVFTKKVRKKKAKIKLKEGLIKPSCENGFSFVFKMKKTYKQKRSPTYCNICRTDLETKEQLANHNASSHGIEEGNLFKCFGCEKRFKTRKARLSHETNFCKGLKEGYKCGKCNRFLPRRSMYEAHMRDHRENPDVELPESIFQCMICSKLFKTKLCLKEHMADHDSLKKNYVCETCGRVFTRQDYLHKHRLTHTGTKQHACPHCGYRTAQKSSLTVHIRKHSGERPYSCDLCPQRCISSSNLRAHRRRHVGVKTFECSICMKKFGYKISLEEHVASVHERSQAFPCEICGALYTRSRGLRRHLHAKHGKQKVDKPQPRDGSTDQEVSIHPKDVTRKSTENVYLKIIENVNVEKKDTLNDNAVYEIKEGEEFVLLNADSGVILTKMY